MKNQLPLMFSIDKTKRIIKNTSAEAVSLDKIYNEIVGISTIGNGVLNPDGYCQLERGFLSKINEFDLLNWNEYDHNGNMIKEASQNDYDASFANLIEKWDVNTKPIYEIEDLLTHHFNQTPDKLLYLKHLEWVILTYFKIEDKSEKHPNLKRFIREWIENTKTKLTTKKEAKDVPKTFEELFYIPEMAEKCLQILRELESPVLDADNNYIGNGKGVFPLWIKILKGNPKSLIRHITNKGYTRLLNQKIKGLNLCEDASEFGDNPKRLINNGVDKDIQRLLSKFSDKES